MFPGVVWSLMWNQRKVVNSRVGFKVSIVDSFNQLLCDLYYLLFASWGKEHRENNEIKGQYRHHHYHYKDTGGQTSTIRGFKSRELVIVLSLPSGPYVHLGTNRNCCTGYIPPIICLGATSPSASIYHPSNLLFVCDAAWLHSCLNPSDEFHCVISRCFLPIWEEVLTRSDFRFLPSHLILLLPPLCVLSISFTVPFSVRNTPHRCDECHFRNSH